MSMQLVIFKKGSSLVDGFDYNSPIDLVNRSSIRCVIEKWTFSDKFMGEQYITFDVVCNTPILFEVGDFCVFRGEIFTLNYVPSCTQTARIDESGDAFKYEGVKMNSFGDELTRCEVLDVVPTTEQYDQYEGTNYTGSSVFNLYCGETIWTDGY